MDTGLAAAVVVVLVATMVGSWSMMVRACSTTDGWKGMMGSARPKPTGREYTMPASIPMAGGSNWSMAAHEEVSFHERGSNVLTSAAPPKLQRRPVLRWEAVEQAGGPSRVSGWSFRTSRWAMSPWGVPHSLSISTQPTSSKVRKPPVLKKVDNG
jgi:hypothetical protein